MSENYYTKDILNADGWQIFLTRSCGAAENPK